MDRTDAPFMPINEDTTSDEDFKKSGEDFGKSDDKFKTILRPITREQAIKMIRGGEAGYYSIFADPPIPNEHFICVYTQQEWYLTTTEHLRIIPQGRVGDGNISAQADIITFHDDEAFLPLFQKDIEQFGKPYSDIIKEHAKAHALDKPCETRSERRRRLNRRHAP